MTKGTTTRRAILAGAASLPALAIPTAAMAGPDPVFAAKSAYRDARRALREFMAEFPGADINRGLCDDELSAVEAMLTTMPSTMAGAAAQFRALCEFASTNRCEFLNEFGIDDGECDEFLPKLASVIESWSTGAAVQS